MNVNQSQIPPDDVLAVVKFDKVSKQEFLKKAQEIIIDLKTRKTRTAAEKLVFGNNSVDILVYGTVKGVVLNEIWFVKSQITVATIDGATGETEIKEYPLP